MILSERAIHFMVVIPGFWSLGHRFRSAARPSLRAALRRPAGRVAGAAAQRCSAQRGPGGGLGISHESRRSDRGRTTEPGRQLTIV